MGADTEKQVALLEPLFGAIRQVIHTAGSCVQPSQDDFLKLLSPVQSGYQAVSLVKEKNNRDVAWSFHYSTIATGASCVSWITVSPTKIPVKSHFDSHFLQSDKPGPFVQGVKEETEFYGNRVIKEYKEKCVQSCHMSLIAHRCTPGMRNTSNGFALSWVYWMN